MQLYRYLPLCPSSVPIALAIGTFDGIHRGHDAVLETVCRYARAHHCPAAVLTFDTHPFRCVNPSALPLRLLSVADKLSLLASRGIDIVYLLRFTEALMASEPADFIEEVLCQRLSVCHVVVGDDFRFGRGRQGDPALLAQYVDAFSLAAVSSVSYEGARVSSTRIRACLLQNQFPLVEQLLGRPFSCRGHVCYGEQRGRLLQFPTMNMSVPAGPFLQGVFVTRVHGLADYPLPAISNVGVRPTVSSSTVRLLETHVFDFDRSVYGALIRVDFLHRLRAEQSFDSLLALRTAIQADAEKARAYHAQKAHS